MHISSRVVFVTALYCALTMLLPSDAAAYVDPGTTGMLSQLLYILFYGCLGVFLYCLRYIKQFLVGGKHRLSRFFTDKIGEDSSSENK